jgi:hypothetical protein
MSQFVPPTKWRKLASGVWKTDFGDDMPEVAILRMSNEEFRKFQSSARFAKSYIDKKRYLKRKLIKFAFVSVPRRPQHECYWTLILSHTPESTGKIIAWPDP